MQHEKVEKTRCLQCMSNYSLIKQKDEAHLHQQNEILK